MAKDETPTFAIKALPPGETFVRTRLFPAETHRAAYEAFRRAFPGDSFLTIQLLNMTTGRLSEVG